MLKSHSLQVEQSELREKINAALGKDDLTDQERSELDGYQKRAQQIEGELRAALTAESLEIETRAFAPDAEGREIRSLLDNLSISDYLSNAVGGLAIEGRAREVNEALKVPLFGQSGGVSIPWLALETPEMRAAYLADREKRAFTDTGDYSGGIGQRPILQRLFGGDIMAALGVRIDSVPVGRTEWPLITAGTDVAQKAEGTAADAAVAATFKTETLKPKRLTGRFEWTAEMSAQVADLEAALRRDLGDAVKAEMQTLTLTGDEATNSHEPDGFLTVITAPTDPSAASDYAAYAGAHAQAVDGIHASMETEVSSVVGVASYRHAAGVYQTGSGESGSEALRRRSMSCMASPFIPAAVNNIQNGNIFHAAGMNGGGTMRGDSVAAIWPTLEVIRDIYTQAASGGVVLTWVGLWDLQAAFRADAYQRVAFQHA